MYRNQISEDSCQIEENGKNHSETSQSFDRMHQSYIKNINRISAKYQNQCTPDIMSCHP